MIFDVGFAQMLAQYDGLQTTLADSSGVCAKKDVVFAKLDQLLAKLAAQGAVLNTTDADAYEVKPQFVTCCVCTLGMVYLERKFP
jgi:hypothetical protein